MIAEILGDKSVVVSLGRKSESIGAAIRKEVGILAIKLVAHVKAGKLTGQVLKVQSGRLRRSITYKTYVSDSMIYALVGTNVIYAAIHEFGGKTKPHDIYPKKGKVLSWIAGNGEARFATVVHHPGSLMPPRSFLRSALVDMHDEIVDGLQNAVNRGASK